MQEPERTAAVAAATNHVLATTSSSTEVAQGGEVTLEVWKGAEVGGDEEVTDGTRHLLLLRWQLLVIPLLLWEMPEERTIQLAVWIAGLPHRGGLHTTTNNSSNNIIEPNYKSIDRSNSLNSSALPVCAKAPLQIVV